MSESIRDSEQKHSWTILEVDRIIDALSARCLSPAGVRSCRALSTTDDREELENRLDRVGEYRLALAEHTEPGSLRFSDVSESLDTLKVKGTQLEGEELVSLAHLVRSFVRLAEWLRDAGCAPFLVADLEAVPLPKECSDRILYLLDDGGNVREERVPELKRIRERIRALQQEIDRRVRGYFNDPRHEQYWSSDAPAYREGRVVLPLKSDFKGRIPGIVHDVSGTGQTIFVEPLDIVEQNNERAEQEAEYRNVIRRILLELTDAVFEARDEFLAVERTVAEIDTVRARARYSLDVDAVRPAIGSQIRLRQSRHPLLPRAEVVPVDIVMEPPVRCLIVTGPNTGGKTVALKSVGLLAVMHQLGMEIPVGTGSTLPLFDTILADIGDEQSLEQSLSTFSGHMRNISAMIRSATERSLLLMDELGAGTDPHEGGALGMAILDEVAARTCHALVTTHHGALKRYGYTHEGVANASMEFDETSLAPTYRLLVGVPGSSHALSIAERSGVPISVLKRAREYVTDGASDTAEILRQLEQTQSELAAERDVLKRREVELQRVLDDLQQREAELHRKREELKAGKLRDLDRFAADARSRMENLVREIREGELDSSKTRRVKQFISELGEGIEEMRGDESDAVSVARPPAGRDDTERSARNRAATDHGSRESQHHPISEGDTVRLTRYGTRGTVERRAKGDSWVVLAGSMRLSVPESEMERLESAPPRESAAVEHRGVDTVVPSRSPAFELDIRGERVAEALDRVERQLDDCLAAGRTHFGILHGKGTGALQRGVHDLLNGRPEVASIDFARPEEGGTGKTLVTLRG